jgi:hypothetical protein
MLKALKTARSAVVNTVPNVLSPLKSKPPLALEILTHDGSS